MKKKNSLFFDTSLIYLFVVLLLIGVRVFSYYVKTNAITSVLLNLIVQIGVMFFIPFLLYKLLRNKKSKQVFQDFNFKKINLKAVLITILIGIIVYLLNIAVASLYFL